jgi:tripeptide aminopeptidase
VPGLVTINGEIRSIDQDLFKGHLAEIEEAAKQCAKDFGVKVTFTTDGYCSGYKFNKEDEIIKKIALILMENGHKVVFSESTGISDSNPLIEAGIQVVTLGDGISDSHTVNESIAVKSLEKLRNLVVEFLIKL